VDEEVSAGAERHAARQVSDRGNTQPGGAAEKTRRGRVRPQQSPCRAADAVGRDDEIGAQLAARVADRRGRTVLPKGGDLRGGADPAVRDRVQQHPVQVSAVEGEQRRHVAGTGALQVAAVGGAQVTRRPGGHAGMPCPLADAEFIQGAQRVRGLGHAGADLA
jgi:hypothetical protein